jgi:hypothetical protein
MSQLQRVTKEQAVIFTNQHKGADFSECGNYRYRLWRIWDEQKPKAMCIGLNPSTANGEKNDATISILIRMLDILGFGGFYMMNCFPYITSNPKLLKRNPASDSWNNDLLTVTAFMCSDIIFSWGGFKVIKETGRDKELIEMFPNAKCFAKSKDGSPIHPLAMQERNGRNPNKPELILYNKI